MIAMATKRRGDYFSQAETLAKKSKTRENLEKSMFLESKVLVKGLRDKQLRWEEYERSLLDRTLVSALAAVYLGAEDAKPIDKMQRAWSSIVGDMLPPLVAFTDETKDYIDQGLLRLGDQTMEFADRPKDILSTTDWDKYFDNDFEMQDSDVLTDPENPEKYQIPNPALMAQSVASSPGGQGRTWPGLLTRVQRYLATPTFGFFNFGRFMVKKEQGFKEMRRIARLDKKCCEDCVGYHEQSWQPIGTLPMPGHGCRCYDRCRCSIEYRQGKNDV